MTLTTGLPTGSVLSCILFLLYVNDLPKISPSITPVLFADDTTLSFSGSSMSELATLCSLSSELKKFITWSRANRLAVNVSKTFQINISTCHFHPPDIFLDNSLIASKTKGKFLGVVLDNKLTFADHIKEVSSKISKSIGIIHHLKNYLQVPTLISLYYSLVYPYLTYCILIWGGTYSSHLTPLITLQKRCIRLITKSPFLAHTDPIFKLHKILKFTDIYKFNLAVFAFKNKNQIESNYARSHNYNTRNRSELLPQFERLIVTSKSLHLSVPKIWNLVPTELKNLSSLNQFKKFYRQYLLRFYED